MERRELLKIIATFTGAAMIGGDLILSGCKSEVSTDLTFSAKNLTLLNEIGETILPKSDTPGAKDANVAEVMKTVVTDCYTPESQAAFMQGIAQMDKESQKKFSKDFMSCTPEQRTELLLALEEETKTYNEAQNKKDDPRREALKKEDKEFNFVSSPKHYYTMMKQLTLLAFFSSEEGMTKALRYLPIPGKFDGAYKYVKGEKAFCS
jgi:hypothetical protein